MSNVAPQMVNRYDLFYPTTAPLYKNMITSRWLGNKKAIPESNINDTSLKTSGMAIIKLLGDYITELQKDINNNTFPASHEINAMIQKGAKDFDLKIVQALQTHQIKVENKNGSLSWSGNPVLAAFAGVINSAFKNANNNFQPDPAAIKAFEQKYQDEIIKVLGQSMKLKSPATTSRMGPSLQQLSKETSKLTPADKVNFIFAQTAEAVKSMNQKHDIMKNLSTLIDALNNLTLTTNITQVEFNMNGIKKTLSFKQITRGEKVGGVRQGQFSGKTLSLDIQDFIDNPDIAMKTLAEMLNNIYSSNALQGLLSGLKGAAFEEMIRYYSELYMKEVLPILMVGRLGEQINKDSAKTKSILTDEKGNKVSAKTIGGESTAGARRSDVKAGLEISFITSDAKNEQISVIKDISAKNVKSSAISAAGGTSYKTIFEGEGDQEAKLFPQRAATIQNNLIQQLGKETGTKISEDPTLDQLMSIMILQKNVLESLGTGQSRSSLQSMNQIHTDIQRMWAIQNARIFIGMDVTDLMKTASTDMRGLAHSMNSIEYVTTIALNWYDLYASYKKRKTAKDVSGLNLPFTISDKTDLSSPSSQIAETWKSWQAATKNEKIDAEIMPEAIKHTERYSIFNNWVKSRANLDLQINTSTLYKEGERKGRTKIDSPIYTQIMAIDTAFRDYQKNRTLYLQKLDKYFYLNANTQNDIVDINKVKQFEVQSREEFKKWKQSAEKMAKALSELITIIQKELKL